MRQEQRAFVPIQGYMGIKKHLLYAGGLMLATSVPVGFYSGTDILAGVKKTLTPGSKPTANALLQPTPSLPDVSTLPPAAQAAISTTPSPMDTLPTPSLAEVLRFDVTVDWVMQRWPRVSTGLQYLQLQGYRVPLVSGTSLQDVAGSLTYYFNAGQQVQRIMLRGTTGDPSALAALLTARYHFTRRLTNDPGVVLYEAVDSDNQPAGTLKIRSAKVIKANQPHLRFEVDLVMDRAM
jgi:hypothetical protein